MNFTSLTSILILSATLSARGPQSPAQPTTSAVVPAAQPSIDQSSICETKDWGIAKDCKVGQKIVFLPSLFGNEQLPVFFAAANCDLRYGVVITKGAVTCIYNPITPKTAPSPAPAASSATQQP